jgi:hypothetical protein
MIIPLVAIALLIVSFFAHVSGGVKWAGFVLVDVVVQVVLGFAAHSVAGLGWLHGPNALVLFGLALYAARRSANGRPVAPATVGSSTA